MQQSVNFVSVIPIKKRRFPVIEATSPSSEEKRSVSEVNKDEPKLFAPTSPSSEGKCSVSEVNKDEPKLFAPTSPSSEEKRSVSEVKKDEPKLFAPTSPSSEGKRSVSEVNKDEPHFFAATTDASDLSKPSAEMATDRSLENYDYNPMNAESELTDDLNNKVDLSLNQTSGMGARAVIVKQEIASEPNESTRELELSVGAPNVELPSEHKKPLICGLGQNSENDRDRSDKSNPLLLSLVMSKGNLDMRDDSGLAAKVVDNQSCAIRSNWDLNTSMEEWEGSINNDSFSAMHEFNNTRDCERLKSSLSNHDVKTTAAIASLGLNKQGHILSERGSSSCIASMFPNHQHEPYVSLGLSLAVPFRELDTAKKRSILYHKSDSTVVSPNLNLQNTNVNISSFSSVKLEPISEVSKSEFNTKSSCSDMGFSNSNSVKQELLKEYNSKIVYPSSISSQTLVEHRSIKSELIHECNQESTASSSATTVSVTPQNSCSSKSSTCTELNIGENQHGFSFHSEEALGLMNKCSNHITGTTSKTFSLGGLCNAGSFAVEDSIKLEMTQIDGRPSELSGKIETPVNGKGKINLSTEMLEENTLVSDFESYENQYTPRKVYNKEEREYEEGEVRTPLQHSAREDHGVDAKKINDVKYVRCDLINVQPFVLSGDQSTNTSDYDGKSVISSENHEETHIEGVISYGPKNEENLSQKVSDKAPETKLDANRSINGIIEKQFDLSRQQDAEKGNGEQVTGDRPVNGSRLVDKATDMINKQVVSARPDSTFSMVEASNRNDHFVDSNYLGNKSRIINLTCATVETSYITRSIPNRELSPGNRKERYSGFNGDMQRQWKRNDTYTDKFARDRVCDSSSRNSRPNFMRGRGRGTGRFGCSRNDWDSEINFASEAYNGPSGYQGPKHKHTSSIVDGDLEHSGYRRKFMNDTISPVYNRPHAMLDEFDGQIMREKNNFRKGYSRILSKSPVRYENHSPSPWPSHRRKSPNEIEELNQPRSPPPYRMRRMISSDHASYREEIISRRRVSPSFVTRHSNDLRDVDSVPEHVHPRLFTPSRRSPPARIFPRTATDVNAEESRKFIERRGGGPLHPSRPSYNGDSDDFHFRPNNDPRPYRFCPDGDTVFDERSNVRERKFVERSNVREREFGERRVREREFDERSNVREREFDERSNVREREFEERINMREREFEGRIKHQPVIASRRIRDIEEQRDGNYRHSGRVWHDDGFNEVSELKRRKF